MLMIMDKQTPEGTGPGMRDPHFHNIISQATRASSAERRPSAVPISHGLRGARLRRANGGRLTDSYSAIPPHMDAKTPGPTDAQRLPATVRDGLGLKRRRLNRDWLCRSGPCRKRHSLSHNGRRRSGRSIDHQIFRKISEKTFANIN